MSYFVFLDVCFFGRPKGSVNFSLYNLWEAGLRVHLANQWTSDPPPALEAKLGQFAAFRVRSTSSLGGLEESLMMIGGDDEVEDGGGCDDDDDDDDNDHYNGTIATCWCCHFPFCKFPCPSGWFKRIDKPKLKGAGIPSKKSKVVNSPGSSWIHFSQSYDWIIWPQNANTLSPAHNLKPTRRLPKLHLLSWARKKMCIPNHLHSKDHLVAFPLQSIFNVKLWKDIHPQVEVQICPLFVGISVVDRNEQQHIKGRRNKSQTKRLSSQVMLTTINFPFHCIAESTLLPNGYI